MIIMMKIFEVLAFLTYLFGFLIFMFLIFSDLMIPKEETKKKAQKLGTTVLLVFIVFDIIYAILWVCTHLDDPWLKSTFNYFTTNSY